MLNLKYEKDLKVFLTLKDEIVEVVGKVYIKATATLVDCESDEEISVTAYARESRGKRKEWMKRRLLGQYPAMQENTH